LRKGAGRDAQARKVERGPHFSTYKKRRKEGQLVRERGDGGERRKVERGGSSVVKKGHKREAGKGEKEGREGATLLNL
jgi:hypothetical protein